MSSTQRIFCFTTVNTVIPEADVVLDPHMKPPTDLQARLLRQIILTGMGDHVARYTHTSHTHTHTHTHTDTQTCKEQDHCFGYYLEYDDISKD